MTEFKTSVNVNPTNILLPALSDAKTLARCAPKQHLLRLPERPVAFRRIRPTELKENNPWLHNVRVCLPDVRALTASARVESWVT
jgi:hypothetical protein